MIPIDGLYYIINFIAIIKGSLEGCILVNSCEIDDIVARIIEQFKDGDTRKSLIKKFAAAAGYECDFDDSKNLVSVRKTPSLRDRLLEGDPDFSKNPPRKWRERENRSEKPIEFVRREYAQWIGKNLLRMHIRKYDRPLYYALSEYQKRHGISISKDLGILARREATEELLNEAGALIDETGGIADPTIEAAVRWQGRLRARQRRSLKRQLGC